MDQSERLAQVAVADKTITTANRELLNLYKVRTAGKALLDDKDTDADTRTKAEAEMETLSKLIAAVEDRRHQARRWIEKMKGESADEGMVTKISQLKDRAQIVIHYAESNGKKLSFTRHVRWDGTRWMGNSTIGGGYMAYRMPGDPVAEAA